MKISKIVVIKCADAIIRKRGRVSQVEVQEAIEKRLHSKLTRTDKTRITLILRYRYDFAGKKIDSKSKRRVEYFE